MEDAARGYRRVVPSPEPLEIVELDVIRSLVARKVVVISTGGGGIPVMRVRGQLQGLEAVIDKDRASALLAAQLHVDLFAISTDTDYVYLNYKKPEQTPLTLVTVSQLEEYHRAGHFPPGNMGPKIESVIHFLRSRRQGSCDHVIRTSVRSGCGPRRYPYCWRRRARTARLPHKNWRSRFSGRPCRFCIDRPTCEKTSWDARV